MFHVKQGKPGQMRRRQAAAGRLVRRRCRRSRNRPLPRPAPDMGQNERQCGGGHTIDPRRLAQRSRPNGLELEPASVESPYICAIIEVCRQHEGFVAPKTRPRPHPGDRDSRHIGHRFPAVRPFRPTIRQVPTRSGHSVRISTSGRPSSSRTVAPHAILTDRPCHALSPRSGSDARPPAGGSGPRPIRCSFRRTIAPLRARPGPPLSPRRVSRWSALSARRMRRYSARDVNMR